MIYRIAKRIPLPNARRREVKGREGFNMKIAKYPFALLEAGHSFMVPTELGLPPQKLFNRVNSAAMRFQRFHPEFRFALRFIKGGVRAWRVAK